MILKHCSLFIFCLIQILFATTNVLAQPSAKRVFDKGEVATLIQNIENGDNASILKNQYFRAPDFKPQFPSNEGLGLLNQELTKEKAGTSRWFALQSVKAWALSQIKGASWTDMLKTYDELFSVAEISLSLKQDEKIVSTIQKAIYDYTLLISDTSGLAVNRPVKKFAYRAWSPSSAFGQEDQPVVTKPTQALTPTNVTLKAFQIYLQLAAQNKSLPPKMTWGYIFSSSGGQRVIEMTNKALGPDMPKTFAVYEVAVDIFSSFNRQKAISILKERENSIDKSKTQQVKWLYWNLALLAENDSEQLKYLKQLVNLTGQKRAELAFWYRSAKDTKSFQEIINTLCNANANEEDIIELAEGLFRWFEDDPHKNRADANSAIVLLQKYLANKRKRDVDSELKARLLLSKFHVANNKRDQAIDVLNVDHLKTSLASEASKIRFQLAQEQRRILIALQKKKQ